MALLLKTLSATLRSGLSNGGMYRIKINHISSKFIAMSILQVHNDVLFQYLLIYSLLMLQQKKLKLDVSKKYNPQINNIIEILFLKLIFCLSFVATVRKPDAVTRSNLTDFGKYVADCLPKYVQKAQLTSGDELEILICPEGVVPVLTFLKDHHNAQFANLVDIAGMDVPSRKYRFEVGFSK